MCDCRNQDQPIPQHRGPHHWHSCPLYEPAPVRKPEWVRINEEEVKKRGVVATKLYW